MKNLIIALLVSLLFGCASAQTTRTSENIYPPTKPENVAILFDKPTKPFETLGFVSGAGGSYGAWMASDNDVFNKMKEEAAKLGANAILLRSDMSLEASQGHAYKKGSALAIRWK